MARSALLMAILALTCTIAMARAQQHGDHHGSQGQSSQRDDAERFEGYVLDRHCAKAEGEALSDAGKSHTRACLIKGQCSRSGYGLVVDGKWYAFDRRGSAQAARLIRTPFFAQHEKWDVTGTKKDGVITVSTLEVKFALR
jgi:hypothetical protein